ncbi:MAG: Crp/Fnr family transcriptional regulator [Anaerolineaceae bacterium]|nr:Crp/Fnr family transcriptional regulator [Anaerolineaceae bacterium]
MFKQADITQALENIPWFLDLKGSQLEKVAKIARFQQVSAGEEVFHEGDREDLLYIVLEGQVALETFVPSQGLIRTFTAEPLDIFGWSSLTPVVRQRLSNARAVIPCRVIAIDGEALKTLCEDDHDIGFIIMRRLANIVASRLLTTRLALFDVIVQNSHETVQEQSKE